MFKSNVLKCSFVDNRFINHSHYMGRCWQRLYFQMHVISDSNSLHLQRWSLCGAAITVNNTLNVTENTSRSREKIKQSPQNLIKKKEKERHQKHEWTIFGLVLIRKWADFVSQTWQPCSWAKKKKKKKKIGIWKLGLRVSLLM